MRLQTWGILYVGSEAWLVVEYGAHRIFGAPRTGEWSSNRWKNFSNIHRIVKIGSKEAPERAFEHGAVYMLAPKPGWWLSMVLITFWTLKLEKGAPGEAERETSL